MRPARIGLAAGLMYVGTNAVLTDEHERLTSVYASDFREAIASPLPFWPFQRETIVLTADGRWLSSQGVGHPATYPFFYLSGQPCRMPEIARLRMSNDQLDAFLFWSRAPFAERAPDGSVLIRDARYYDPRARDRFTVELKDLRCQPQT